MPTTTEFGGVTTSAEPATIRDCAHVLEIFVSYFPDQSQTAIARMLGLSEQTFRRYLRGDQTPDMARLAEMIRLDRSHRLQHLVLLLVAGRDFGVSRICDRLSVQAAANGVRDSVVSLQAKLVDMHRFANVALADSRFSADEITRWRTLGDEVSGLAAAAIAAGVAAYESSRA